MGGMRRAEIRELQQHAYAMVAEVVQGETATITDRGRPVAQLSPLPASRFEQMLAAGVIRPASRRLQDLPPAEEGEALMPTLLEMRDDERY